MEKAHKLEIRPVGTNGQELLLDGFKLQKVIAYEVKSSAKETELTVKLKVSSLKFAANDTTDNITGNLNKNI